MASKRTSYRGQYPEIRGSGSGQYPTGHGSVTETGPKGSTPEHYSTSKLKADNRKVYGGSGRRSASR